MPNPIHRLPTGDPNGDDGLPPLDLYKLAVEEYRFQAQFNWTRTQYLLAFNAAILTAGAAVASRHGRSAALVFALGAVASAASIFAVRAQHAYYRAARNRMQRAEDVLGVPTTLRVDTTATLGRRGRFVSVQQIVYLLLGALAVSNAVGVVIILQR